MFPSSGTSSPTSGTPQTLEQSVHKEALQKRSGMRKSREGISHLKCVLRSTFTQVFNQYIIHDR